MIIYLFTIIVRCICCLSYAENIKEINFYRNLSEWFLRGSALKLFTGLLWVILLAKDFFCKSSHKLLVLEDISDVWSGSIEKTFSLVRLHQSNHTLLQFQIYEFSYIQFQSQYYSPLMSFTSFMFWFLVCLSLKWIV